MEHLEVSDLNSTYLVSNRMELVLSLMRQHEENRNCFWIRRLGTQHPVLRIMTNRLMAVMHYFPKDGDSGHRSMQGLLEVARKGTTTFLQAENDSIQIENDEVVTLDKAIEAAVEFSLSSTLP